MAFHDTLVAKPVSISELFSNGKLYEIPSFQRSYAWGDEECLELWQDLMGLVEHKDPHATHFLGAIVLQPVGTSSGRVRVIDGQQRLITLSLLALAVLRRLSALASAGVEEKDNLDRHRLLKEKFVSVRSAASLVERPRLTLNAADNDHYADFIVQGKAPPRTGLSASQGRMDKALALFVRQLQERFPGDAVGTGAALSGFLDEQVASRLRLIQIDVTDDETAFTVFETLNARGVALGTADLLKNHLFSRMAQHGAEERGVAERLWQRIVNHVPSEEASTLVFHHLASQVPALRERRVFAEMRRLTPNGERAYEMLHVLVEKAALWEALGDPDHERWAGAPEVGAVLRELAVLRFDALRPLLLVAVPLLEGQPARLVRLLRHLVALGLRAKVAHVNTGDIQRAVHETARRVATGERKSPLRIAQDLRAMLVSDETFHAAFSTWSLSPSGPTGKLLRYVLRCLEEDRGGQMDPDLRAGLTVEHLLPQHRSEGFGAFDSPEAYVNRLGNLTPLEKRLNRGLGSIGDWERRRAVYRQSGFALTREIQAAEWTPEALRERQRGMADRALVIWPLPAALGAEEDG